MVSGADVRERSVHGDGAHVEALQYFTQRHAVIEGLIAPHVPLLAERESVFRASHSHTHTHSLDISLVVFQKASEVIN